MGAREKAREAQRQRAKKWGIEIREDGNVTKPSEYADVPDDEFLDPVNYAYPVNTRARALAAVRYWGMPRNRKQYSAKSQKIIDRRIEQIKRKWKIGEFNKGRVIKVQEEQKLFWAIALEPGSPQKRDLQGQWVSAPEIEKAAHLFMMDYQNSGVMHESVTPDVVIVESAIAPVDMVVNGEPVMKGTWFIVAKVFNDELWMDIKKGKYTGVSIGGRGKIIPDEEATNA
jgi:hypothetical protein